MALGIADIGMTQEQIQEAVIARVTEAACTSLGYDQNEDEWKDSSGLLKGLRKEVQKQIDAAVTKLGNEKVAPEIERVIEGVVLQKTNLWGDKKGEPMTFTEYLLDRAQAYMTEPVNFDGKTKGESYSPYDFKGKQTRLVHMVHQHLHYSIEDMMKTMLASANEQLVGGIEGAVKIALKNMMDKIKVNVKAD